jgi:hypothetical protein
MMAVTASAMSSGLFMAMMRVASVLFWWPQDRRSAVTDSS